MLFFFFIILFSESLTVLQLLIHKSFSSIHWLWMSYPSIGFVWHTLSQRICLVVQWAPRLQKPKSWCKGHWYSCNPWPGNFRPFSSKFIWIKSFVNKYLAFTMMWEETRSFQDRSNNDWNFYYIQGNVALDVARILLRPPPELATTDIASHALEALQESAIRFVFLRSS